MVLAGYLAHALTGEIFGWRRKRDSAELLSEITMAKSHRSGGGSYLLPEPAPAGVGLGVAAQQRRRVAGPGSSKSPRGLKREERKPFGLRSSLILAAIYSRGTCCPTTIDVLMFHFRVRNGTGWDHQAMTTRRLLYLQIVDCKL